jgi:hypothetical protein
MALNDIKILQEQSNGSLKETLLTPTTIGAASTADIPLVPTIVIDDNVIEFFGYPTTIASNAFDATGVTAVQIGNSVTSIGSYAFQYNSLTSLTIPNSVTSIADGAFANNSLTAVTIGTGVTSIGGTAFANNALTTVTIPNSVTSIGSAAFFNNSLTSVTIGTGVTSIGGFAFRNNSLTSVTIPNSVTSIDSQAFYGNFSLATVNCYAPATAFVGSNAFYYTASPLTINVPTSGAVADTWTAGTGLSFQGNTNVTVAKNL